MELGFCYVVLDVFRSGVANCSLLYVQPFLHIVFEVEIVESSDDVFWDVARVVFPVDKHSLSVGERFYCRRVVVGVCWRLRRSRRTLMSAWRMHSFISNRL